MLVSPLSLLLDAHKGGYAIGAFNVYDLEGAIAVARAAESARSPALVQIHPSSLRFGGSALIALCLATAREASVPMNVHLDHGEDLAQVKAAANAGIGSAMIDGSHLEFGQNVGLTRQVTNFGHQVGIPIEAELGRLAGSEDGLSVSATEARMTNPEQAAVFVKETGVDVLAVCIGNVHGAYPRVPKLDFNRLNTIAELVSVPLALHGASGLPDEAVRRAITDGIAKVNVNTEVRTAYVEELRQQLASTDQIDFLPLMESAISAMQKTIAQKLTLFGSRGKA